MILSKAHMEIIKQVLAVEHSAIARRLYFIPPGDNIIEEGLLYQAIGMLDELSRLEDEKARKVVITIAALLWTYRLENWKGLRDFLVLVLSRVGFAPSAIMVDDEYDPNSSTFSGLNSFINEVNVAVHQIEHEIFVGGKKFLITAFQKMVWNKLDEVKFLGISAPTSAGKSFIILLKVIQMILEKEGSVIYIVPTLSLIAQVAHDFNEQLTNFGIRNYRIATTYNSHDSEGNKIYILTQEKAIAAFSQNDEPYKKVHTLVVDEIQNIERVANEDDQRAKILYDTLMEFRHTCDPDLIVVSGPRVDGLKELGVDVFDEHDAQELSTRDSPVVSITYSISKQKKKYYFNQYAGIFDSINTIPIVNSSNIQGYGGSQYGKPFIKYLFSIIQNLGKESRNIIFSPTASQARKIAIDLSKHEDEILVDENVKSLVSYIRETVHEKYDMCHSIPKGFAYHHGKTPPHVRAVIERAIKDRMVANIVCTTTLMQGVNLPAQNVILRNPNLAINAKDGVKPKLTNYEIANLRGRAGRLLKDFVGRTYVLEEDSFDKDSSQLGLFHEAEKSLHSGYGEKFNSFKDEIQDGLLREAIPNEQNKEYAFLMTYIRQVILKHENDASRRLGAVGIILSDDQIVRIQDSMKQLSVPKEVCFKNRYWDPIDLNSLYTKRDDYDVPTLISDGDIENSLYDVLVKIQWELSNYYKKYFNVNSERLLSVCISAGAWMKERPLKVILSHKYYNTADKIESGISLLQKDVSYGLPMLLKPLYDILAPDNMFLRFIEIGAYKPVTRKMIELNIPRETAIDLSKQYFNNFNFNEKHIEEAILYRLREVKNHVDYWRRIQIEGMV